MVLTTNVIENSREERDFNLKEDIPELLGDRSYQSIDQKHGCEIKHRNVMDGKFLIEHPTKYD